MKVIFQDKTEEKGFYIDSLKPNKVYKITQTPTNRGGNWAVDTKVVTFNVYTSRGNINLILMCENGEVQNYMNFDCRNDWRFELLGEAELIINIKGE